MLFDSQERGKQDDQIQVELQILDDVFHRTIISLERLEQYLQNEGVNSNLCHFQTTAIGSSRDIHDDEKNSRGIETYYDELALDCMAVFKNVKFNDEKVTSGAIECYLNDLFEWYAGRDNAEFDEIESCSIPLLAAISHYVKKTRDIDNLFEEYVYKSKSIPELSLEEKFVATKEGMEAWIRTQHIIEEDQTRNVTNTNTITSHKRGNAIDGYKRLLYYLANVPETNGPLKVLIMQTWKYLPSIANVLPHITENNIDNIYKVHNDVQDKTIVNANQKERINSIYPYLLDTLKLILKHENIEYTDINIIIK